MPITDLLQWISIAALATTVVVMTVHK